MSTEQEVSERVSSATSKNEEILWSSGTNVLPQVIASIPLLLFAGGFVGIWSAGFFGGISMLIFNSILVPVTIGILAFLAPIILFVVKTYYESSREEFVVTEDNIICATANSLSVNISSYPRSDIKQIGVRQSFIAEYMDVGKINFEVFQTEMQTDNIVFEGIDNPYRELENLRELLSEDLEGDN